LGYAIKELAPPHHNIILLALFSSSRNALMVTPKIAYNIRLTRHEFSILRAHLVSHESRSEATSTGDDSEATVRRPATTKKGLTKSIIFLPNNRNNSKNPPSPQGGSLYTITCEEKYTSQIKLWVAHRQFHRHQHARRVLVEQQELLLVSSLTGTTGNNGP
jgi:hypothetical protein